MSFPWWGVCVCFLKFVRKGRFRNVWARRGGGGHFFYHRAANGTMCTKHALHNLDHSLFQVRVVVIVAPLYTRWDPIWADIPLLVNGNIFLEFPPFLQPVCLHTQQTTLSTNAHQGAFACVLTFCADRDHLAALTIVHLSSRAVKRLGLRSLPPCCCTESWGLMPLRSASWDLRILNPLAKRQGLVTARHRHQDWLKEDFCEVTSPER